MDDFQFDDILKRIYELEGLIMVARRNEADPSLLLPLIHGKAAEISDMLAHVQADGNSPKQATEDTTEAPEPEAPETCHGGEASACAAEPDGCAQQENEAYEPQPEEPEDASQGESQAPILTENDDDGRSSHDSPEEPVAEMTFDYVEPQKAVIDDELATDENTNGDDYTPANSPKQETYANTCNYDGEPVTVDELLQRNLSRDLKKAFTINDRFRFRRELFGNSDIEMNDALNLVEAMQSYSEAEEYFYDMLNWDKESPEVADFMSIIRNHFYSK